MLGPEQIGCIVFDFDGTLANSNRIKRDTFFEVVEGIEGAAATVERLLGDRPATTRHEVFAEVTADPAERERLVARYGTLCEERVVGCPEIPGASEALERLSARYPLYINSATPQRSLRDTLERRAIAGWFKGIFGPPGSKAEHLERIAVLEGMGPRQILFVGDGPADADAANAFGCWFAGFETPLPEPRGEEGHFLYGALKPLVDRIAGSEL